MYQPGIEKIDPDATLTQSTTESRIQKPTHPSWSLSQTNRDYADQTPSLSTVLSAPDAQSIPCMAKHNHKPSYTPCQACYACMSAGWKDNNEVNMQSDVCTSSKRCRPQEHLVKISRTGLLNRHPQTDVVLILLEPQTPLPVPQAPIPEPAVESFWLLEFEFEEAARSSFCSLLPNP